MNAEQWGTFLAFVCAPAANLFPLLYGTTAPWWRSWTGRAIIISKVGLALLVDAAVLFRWNGAKPYWGFNELRLGAFALITVGTYLYLFAFAHEQYMKRNRPPAQPSGDTHVPR